MRSRSTLVQADPVAGHAVLLVVLCCAVLCCGIPVSLTVVLCGEPHFREVLSCTETEPSS